MNQPTLFMLVVLNLKMGLKNLRNILMILMET